MPNIWTHILFVDQLCEKLGRSDLLQTSPAPLHLGAQGPDPFFYHNFLPFSPDRKVADIGLRMHTEKCGPVLMDMIHRGMSEKNVLQGYILGFVSHHILDRNTHPFIHYHAGYEKNKHQEFEVLVDTILLKRFRNLEPWRTPVHKEIKIGRKKQEISTFMHELLAEHFPDMYALYNKKVVPQSFRHIQAAQRVLYDPWKWKNRWFGSLVSSFSHQPIRSDIDFLNELNNEWHHPATQEMHNDSFLDLYNASEKEASLLFQHIFDYWETGSSSAWKAMSEIISNISYDTGEPVVRMLENRYSRPII